VTYRKSARIPSKLKG